MLLVCFPVIKIFKIETPELKVKCFKNYTRYTLLLDNSRAKK